MSFESVKAILDTHTYNTLIGLREDAWLEVKSSTPYNLDLPEGRYELAKDVSAFANGAGGIVLVGLRTTKQETTQTEEITAFELCPQDAFISHRYVSLIEAYIHPAIEGLNVYWSPVSEDGTQGLGVIEIPAQTPERQYFLIANAVDGGSRIRQFVFGIVRRNESSNDPFTIAQLYEYMQKDKNSLSQTLTRMEEKLDAIIGNQSRSVESPDPEELYTERSSRILEEGVT
jgi:predicted HTH transcriptional regulator